MAKRLRVLVSAYACNPERGSESGVGWGWVTALAPHHDLTVITDANNREAIERYRSEHGGGPEVTFRYLQRTRWLALEAVWPPAYLWTYRRWLGDAYRMAEHFHREQPFDLAHQMTYVGFRVPGRLWKLGVPFVWGPIGGLENTPLRLLSLLGPAGALYYVGRNALNTLHKWLLPAPKRAFRAARGGIIAATDRIRDEIRVWYGEDSHVVCETGPTPQRASAPSRREEGDSLRIVWSGQHLPGKALPALLRALALVPPAVHWRLTVLGDGKCSRKWRAEADRLGVSRRCHWLGWVDRGRALAEMAASHVCVISSVKDLTSTVTLEALASGLPVVCPDHCGFSSVVTPDCGIKVPIPSPGPFIDGLAEAIQRLAADEDERRRLAAGALRRAVQYDWDRKARDVDAIYQGVVDRDGRANGTGGDDSVTARPEGSSSEAVRR